MELTEETILKYDYLVKSIAGFMNKNSNLFDLDDLISFGYFGLIDAIKKYDSSRQASFITYANIRIRGAILDGIRKEGKIGRNREKIDLEEIANSKQKLTKKQREILQKISIATTKNYDSLIQKGITDYNFEIVELYELKHILEQMCSNLTAQEKQVLKLLYDDQLTLTRIGKQLHISESRVSQVKTKALKKLRTEENIKKLQDYL